MYIATTYIAHFSRILGMENKRVIQVREIAQVMEMDRSVQVITTTGQEKVS